MFNFVKELLKKSSKDINLKEYKQILKKYGINLLLLDNLSIDYWQQITEAIILFCNMFPCMKGFISGLILKDNINDDLNKEKTLMYIKYPQIANKVIDKKQYKRITNPIIYISNIYVDDEKDTEKIKKIKTDFRNYKSISDVLLHELCHLLELSLTVILQDYNLYNKNLNSDDLFLKSIEIAESLKRLDIISPIMTSIFGTTIEKYYIKNKNGFKDYFNKLVNNSVYLPNHSFDNDHEFFAEMISNKLINGDNANEIVTNYYNKFVELYSEELNTSFEEYKKNK